MTLFINQTIFPPLVNVIWWQWTKSWKRGFVQITAVNSLCNVDRLDYRMYLSLVSPTDAHCHATPLSKGSQKHLKQNRCKLSCQERLIAKIPERLMIITVRMHSLTGIAVHPLSTGHHTQLSVLLRNNACQTIRPWIQIPQMTLNVHYRSIRI